MTTLARLSAEIVGLIQQGRAGWATATLTTQVSGSPAIAVASFATAEFLRG